MDVVGYPEQYTGLSISLTERMPILPAVASTTEQQRATSQQHTDMEANLAEGQGRETVFPRALQPAALHTATAAQ